MITRVFRLLSQARGKRIFHPVGEAYSGSLLLDDSSKNFFGEKSPAAVEVIVRISRAFYIPGIKSDFYGIALRLQFKDQYQDLLFASAGSGRITKYLFKPSAKRLSDTFSMDVPYKIDNKRYLFWVQLSKKPEFINKVPNVDPGTTITLQVSRLVGSRKNLGTITLDKQLPKNISREIRYNPWNSLDNIKLAGLINRLRRHAYVQSQIGRGTIK